MDDGICDPECCDGSDEQDGKLHCPNRCEKVGRDYRKAQTELENLRRAGGKIREKYIADGKKDKENLEAEIAKLEVELEVAKENEERLKRELERAESMDKEVIEEKKKTKLFGQLVKRQGAIKELMEKNEALKGELRTLTMLLDDLAKGYNPNYQDMAVKGAVVGYKEWRGLSSTEENNVDQLAGENSKLNSLLDEGEFPASTLSQLLNEDPLDIMDGGLAGVGDKRVSPGTSTGDAEGGLLFRIHEYLPDPFVPYFEAMIDTLLDVLIKANVIKDVQRMRPRTPTSTTDEPVHIASARKAYTSASSHLSRLQSDLTTRHNRLKDFSSKYGRQGEFKALENKCISLNTGEYTYEYCFFGRTTQIPNSGGAQVSLGTFSNFNPKGDKNWEEDEYWLQQIYARGQKCWNGPERSAVVDLVCAVENEVRGVFEAEKCIYSLTVGTPAVCFPPAKKQEKEEVKREEREEQLMKEEKERVVKDEL